MNYLNLSVIYIYIFNLAVKYSLTQTCFTVGSHKLLEEKFDADEFCEVGDDDDEDDDNDKLGNSPNKQK